VPSVVLLESLTGRQRTDAPVNRFLKTCGIVADLPELLARRAAALRAHAGRGSAVDAIVVAMAEPGGHHSLTTVIRLSPATACMSSGSLEMMVTGSALAGNSCAVAPTCASATET
jgi:hypothetical protein